MFNFIKYQSLGNDLIVVDLCKESPDFVAKMISTPTWSQDVVRLCDRHYGIGADGVLLLSNNAVQNVPEIHVFNADGSQAENCLNGTRCVAHYLHMAHMFPDKFQIKIGRRIVLCELEQGRVITHVGQAMCTGARVISVPAGAFTGHIVSMGNPHCIIFEQVTPEWLALHGKSIESHEIFPQKTNVEFVWKLVDDPIYSMIVYERGCGPTLACGTGAAACVGLLFSRQEIKPFQKVVIKMPGGSLVAWVDGDGYIALQAEASLVFKGVFKC